MRNTVFGGLALDPRVGGTGKPEFELPFEVEGAVGEVGGRKWECDDDDWVLW